MTDDLITAMRGRFRKHMLTAFGGIFGCIVIAILIGAATRLAFGPDQPGWTLALPALGILAIPVIGISSAFRNLRCPACDGIVIYQLSWKFSLFGSRASNECRHCGKTIFDGQITQSFRKVFVVMFAIGIGLGVIGAIANIAATR